MLREAELAAHALELHALQRLDNGGAVGRLGFLDRAGDQQHRVGGLEDQAVGFGLGLLLVGGPDVQAELRHGHFRVVQAERQHVLAGFLHVLPEVGVIGDAGAVVEPGLGAGRHALFI
ncbi:hypothetical protein FQZ97_814200 [compost metagenome]